MDQKFCAMMSWAPHSKPEKKQDIEIRPAFFSMFDLKPANMHHSSPAKIIDNAIKTTRCNSRNDLQ